MTSALDRRHPAPDSVRSSWARSGWRSTESLDRMLEDAASRWPHRDAVITEQGSTTFAELARRSSQAAHALLDRGVRSGDVVSWMLPTGPDAVAIAAAIWRIGAVSSPLVPVYGPSEIAAALDQVGPRAIITTAAASRRSHPDEFDEACRTVGIEPSARLLAGGTHPGWRSLDEWDGGPLPTSIVGGTGDDPCLVLFTSGTESRAKGVLHSTSGLVHELRTTVTEWGITYRDTMVMASPMTHITGLLQGFMIPSRVGAAALLIDRWRPETCVDLIERHAATYMAGATPFLRELLAAYDAAGRDHSSLVQYCCGGASIPPALIHAAQDLGVSAYRAWGMTELPTATLPNELDPLDARAETDGRLAPGVELRVVGSDGQTVEPGDEGELQLRGPEMMLGYVDASLDRSAFTPDAWFRTGDLGRLDEDGRVLVTGRLKDIINRGGEKFSAREIEEAVGSHPDVTAVAVVAVPGGRLGERVGVAVVSERHDLTVQELGAIVTGAGLARQKQPELLVVLPSLPVNATGKIDKRSLVSLLDETSSAVS